MVFLIALLLMMALSTVAFAWPPNYEGCNCTMGSYCDLTFSFPWQEGVTLLWSYKVDHAGGPSAWDQHDDDFYHFIVMNNHKVISGVMRVKSSEIKGVTSIPFTCTPP